MNDPSQHETVLNDIRQAIRWDGVQPALHKLNALSAHRFTGLFLFDGDRLANTYIVDRTTANAQLFTTFPANMSYCLLVKEAGEPLMVTNAPADERLVGHPARESVQSYCGAPLRDAEGTIFGTICSFSTEPCDAEDSLLPLLSRFAAMLLECERLQEIGWRKPRSA